MKTYKNICNVNTKLPNLCRDPQDIAITAHIISETIQFLFEQFS